MSGSVQGVILVLSFSVYASLYGLDISHGLTVE